LTHAQSGPAPPSRIEIRKLRAKAELIELLGFIELFDEHTSVPAQGENTAEILLGLQLY
jgi:hypothetical protein